MLRYMCIHTNPSSCLLESGVKITDTYTHPLPRLIACTNIHTHRLLGASPSHTYTVTRNLRTHYASVG